MCYAEKLLVVQPNQLTPMHAVVEKADDIIKRGGATLAVELSGADPLGRCDPQARGQFSALQSPRYFGPVT